MHALAPLATARSGGATIVDAHEHVTFLGKVTVPHAATPTIDHTLPCWLSVDVKQHGILLLWIKIGRLHAPAVQLDTFLNLHAERLDGRLLKFGHLVDQLCVVLNHFDHFVRWQLHPLAQRWHIVGRKGVHGARSVGRDVVAVGTVVSIAFGSDTLEIGAVDADAVEVAASWFIRSCGKVEQRGCFPLRSRDDLDHFDHIHAIGGDRCQIETSRGGGVNALPSASIAEPEESPVLQPLVGVVEIDPGIIHVFQNRIEQCTRLG